MSSPVHLVLGATLRLYIPLMALFAMSLLAAWPANTGVGFAAGLVLVLVFALHILVFGAEAARAAFSPLLARLMLSFGAIVAFAAAGLPRWSAAAQAEEAGLLLATLGAGSLVVAALCGRAATLRDEDW